MQLQSGVFPIHPEDFSRVVAVWEASVRATHHFVSEADIQIFEPLVRDALPHIPALACVRDGSQQVAGFIAVVDGKVEMLFIHPAARGQGAGGRLLNYAVTTLGATTLDVNEQNEQAVGFYLHMGFEVVGRSELDGTGKPYPLLHLRRSRLIADMPKDAMLAEIAGIVEEACAKETNIFGYGIWTHHITQVVKHGKRLAEMFGADPEIVEIAALLHDYASVKDAALYADHHIHGPAEAEKLLRGFNYPQERIEAVKACIAAHRGSVPAGKRSTEAECLANADAMAHIEQVPALLELAFVQHGMRIDAGAEWVRAKLARSWNKLHPAVRALLQEKYDAALLTLTSLNEAAA